LDVPSRADRAALKAARGQSFQTDLLAAAADSAAAPVAPAAAPAAAPVAPAAAPAAAPAVDADPEVFADWQPIDGMIVSSWVSGGPVPRKRARKKTQRASKKAPRFPFRPFNRVAVDRVPSLGVRVPAFKKNFRSCLTPGLVDRSCHRGLESI
jgi:hypothetical protein